MREVFLNKIVKIFFFLAKWISPYHNNTEASLVKEVLSKRKTITHLIINTQVKILPQISSGQFPTQHHNEVHPQDWGYWGGSKVGVLLDGV